MDRAVDSARVAGLPSRRLVQAALCGFLVLMAICAWALESSILLPEHWTAGYRSLASSLDAWAVGHLPVSILPFLRNMATVALSPLLYLGLAAVLVAERIAPADEHQHPISLGLVYDGVAWFVINAPIVAFTFVGALAATYYLLDNYLPFLRLDPALTARLPAWTLVVAAVVLGDFFKWVHHYVTHKTPLLWHFHSVHHSQRELNLFTQARFHAVEFVTLAPLMYLPLAVLNLDFELAVWVVLGVEWYARITHANLRTHFGPLRFALVTPQSHRIHHSLERRHRDQNFGTLFSVWDRLFGTRWPGIDEYPATGIADESFPAEGDPGFANLLACYFAQLFYPFQQLLKSWRSR